MLERNPYAPSQASLHSAGEPSVDPGPWRDGNVLVMRHSSVLPERCVKCNEPATGSRLTWRLYWHPSAYFLLGYLSLLLYVVVALIVRRKAVIRLALCARHRSRRRWFLGLGLLGFLGFLGMLFAAQAIWRVDWAGLGQAAFILSILCVLAGVMGSRILFPAHIDTAYVRVHGCGTRFLSSLPAFLK